MIGGQTGGLPLYREAAFYQIMRRNTLGGEIEEPRVMGALGGHGRLSWGELSIGLKTEGASCTQLGTGAFQAEAPADALLRPSQNQVCSFVVREESLACGT